MTILHLVNVRWWNASASYAVFAARALAARGHRCIVVADAGSPAARQAAVVPGLVVAEIPRLDRLSVGGSVAGGRALVAMLRRERPEVILAYRPESHAWAVVATALSGARTPVIAARTDARVPRAGAGQRWLAARTAGTLYPAVYARDRDLARLALDPSSTWVAPCPVDTEAFAPGDRTAARAALGLPSDAHIAAMVARFAVVKGQRDVVEAFARVAADEPRAWLVLSGVEDDVRRDELASRGEELGCGDRVRLLGVLDDPRVVFAAADVGVVASRGSEAICRVAAEWLACGRPVIGTRMHAVAEAIEDGVSGWLVDPGDVRGLAEALREAFALDDTRRAAFAAAARARAENTFSLARFGATLDDICARVCRR